MAAPIEYEYRFTEYEYGYEYEVNAFDPDAQREVSETTATYSIDYTSEFSMKQHAGS
jgi:hypothetical protein